VVVESYGLVESQGAPQFGLRRYGVPVGGWFDQRSAMISNALVGRATDSVCLELTMASVRLLCTASAQFSLAGAPCEVRINTQLQASSGLYFVKPNSEIFLKPPPHGVRTYLSAAFLDIPVPGTRIPRGHELRIAEQSGFCLGRPLDGDPLPDGVVLRVVSGAHAELFDTKHFLTQSFSVSARLNRVGIRLEQQGFPHALELTSEPAGFGTVQVTPDGSPIILGPDGPTIGGYPKIAHVISADLDALGQLRAGQTVRFERVELDEARRLRTLQLNDQQRKMSEIRLALGAS